MSDQTYILAPEAVTVHISVEPVLVAMDFLSDMASLDYLSGISQRVIEVHDSLTPERRLINRVIFNGLFSSVAPRRSFPDMPTYIDYLAKLEPEQLRDRAIEWMCTEECEGMRPLTKEEALDRDTFLSRMEQMYAAKKAEKGAKFDREFYEEVHHWLSNPLDMQKKIVEHMTYMWDTVLAAEWRRSRPMIEESAEAFQELDYNGLSALEAIRMITGRDMSQIWPEWPQNLIFVPTPYIGPYIGRWESEDKNTLWVIFGARLPEGARIKSPALSRSELVVRLNALADDTRLRIIELLTQYEELCAQDIINLLDLSQSAASRHLRQLTATGYLVERRKEVSKCYALNKERFDDTMRAVRRFVRINRTVGMF
ncbi:MAG: metalloregulator ArsR/SmtB family transcription factor [Anaerolineae bacterium]